MIYKYVGKSRFYMYLSLKKDVDFHLYNVNPLHPRMICAKFVLALAQ